MEHQRIDAGVEGKKLELEGKKLKFEGKKIEYESNERRQDKRAKGGHYLRNNKKKDGLANEADKFITVDKQQQ